jgi:hypothetical protein
LGLLCGGGFRSWNDSIVFTQAAQFGGGTEEEAMGLDAGAVDGFLLCHGTGGGIEFGFEGGTAVETPTGGNDFGGLGVFHERGGMEFVPECFVELVVVGGFFGAHVVASGEEAGGYGILGGAGFAFGGAGTGGEPGVGAVGGDLSFSGQGGSFSNMDVIPIRRYGMAVTRFAYVIEKVCEESGDRESGVDWSTGCRWLAIDHSFVNGQLFVLTPFPSGRGLRPAVADVGTQSRHDVSRQRWILRQCVPRGKEPWLLFRRS